MRTKMAFPIRFWGVLLVLLLIYQLSTATAAGNCKFEKKINLDLDLSSSDSLIINALAGDLQISGFKTGNEARIEGYLCVSRQEWLEQSGIELTTGKQARIDTILPAESGGWFSSNDQYIERKRLSNNSQTEVTSTGTDRNRHLMSSVHPV